MITVITRRIIATPARSAAETWNVIAGLLAPDTKGDARKEILSVIGIASSLIASEAMKDAAIVVSGSGPRVRIRCIYDEEAIIGEDASEERLAICPTEGDWVMSFPCPPDDLKWVQESLRKHSTRITARDLSEEPFSESTETESSNKSRAVEVTVDRESFFRL
jgi:hypothetical protein